MPVRAKKLFNECKEHRYWSVVEYVRNRDGRAVQRRSLSECGTKPNVLARTR